MVGLLWTPPYWGWNNGAYVFNSGYWGPHVGYYGGVNYGYGYGGRGYEGGRWDNGRFAYNRTANNFGAVHVSNVYTQNVTVINNTRVSYAGGTGGLATQPTAEERQAAQDHHVPLTEEQTRHITTAARYSGSGGVTQQWASADRRNIASGAIHWSRHRRRKTGQRRGTCDRTWRSAASDNGRGSTGGASGNAAGRACGCTSDRGRSPAPGGTARDCAECGGSACYRGS